MMEVVTKSHGPPSGGTEGTHTEDHRRTGRGHGISVQGEIG